MNASWYYLFHLSAFAAGLGVLWLLKQREVSWPIRATVGGVMSAAMAVFMFRISEPPDLFSDFYKAYYPASRAVLAQESSAGLAETMKQGAGGFVNLPILAYLFAPFGMLSPGVAGWVFLFLGVAATVVAWLALSRLAGLDRDQSMLLLFTAAACGPLHNSLREGNTTHFILLLMIAGLWSLRWKREFAAGWLFGIAALIKLPLLLLGAFFFFRGRWRVALGGAMVCGAAACASVMVFGWDLHVHWYEHSVKPYAETPLAAFNVQSIQGFFARMQHGSAYLTDWTPHAVHPLVRLISRVAVFTAMASAAVVFHWPGRWRRNLATPVTEVRELEVCIAILLAMVISTVSWSHYYLWVLLPAAFVIGGNPEVLSLRGVRFCGWCAVIGTLPPVLLVHPGDPLLRRVHVYFVVSHYLIATLLLLAVLLVCVWWIKTEGNRFAVRAKRKVFPARVTSGGVSANSPEPVAALDSESPPG